MVRTVKHSPLLKRLVLIFLGFLIVCMLGGRQYIHNIIDARNPFYPFSLKIFGCEIFEGWPRLQQMDEKMSAWEKENGWDKFNWWEKESRKFFYLPSTAGPKYFLFFIVAALSLFIRPPDIPRSIWYCLAFMWIVPIVIFYTNSSTSFARKGPFIDGGVRFIVASFALFAIQAIALIHTWKHYFKPTEVFLSALVAWDILRIYQRQVWNIEVSYPFLILLLVGLGILYEIGVRCLNRFENSTKVTRNWNVVIGRRRLMFIVGFIFLFVGFYFLQVYKDATRYAFYRTHFANRLPGKLVDAWEFLDEPHEKKTIAMAMDSSGDNWFFYPLFGRWLQNDIAYISAKYKWEVPTWFDNGVASGNDFTVWLYNVRRTNVDHIFVAAPMPQNQLKWINQRNKIFKMVFLNNDSKIFKYMKEDN